MYKSAVCIEEENRRIMNSVWYVICSIDVEPYGGCDVKEHGDMVEV